MRGLCCPILPDIVHCCTPGLDVLRLPVVLVQQVVVQLLHRVEPDSLRMFDVDLDWENNPDVQKALHTLQPTALPEGLSPGQAAQVSEIIEYVHLRLRDLMETATIKTPKDDVALNFEQWQNLIDLQALLAGYLRNIGDPGETMG